MSILEQAKPAVDVGLIISLVGAPGTGKTSTASTFPNPFLIRTQGEAVPRDSAFNPVSIGITDTPEKLWDQLSALIKDDHEYKTLIIDSSSGLEGMFIQDILNKDQKAKGIQQAMGGYGAGRSAVAAQHMRVRKAAEILRTQRGMNVVFIAHADINRIDPPDTEGYNQYSLRLHKESMKYYVDDVDLVGFLKQTAIIKSEDGKANKAVTTGEIVLTTYLNPAYCSKNRLGIKEEITVVHGENPLEGYL